MKYLFATNINNSGESGIIDMDSQKLMCICPLANAEIILQSLNGHDTNIINNRCECKDHDPVDVKLCANCDGYCE